MAKQSFKTGEKILFSIFGIFMLVAVLGYAAMEYVRLHTDKPLFVNRTHYDLSEQGKQGSLYYRKAQCNSCHRVMRSGTSMGLSLDGIGSKRDYTWLLTFLTHPESTLGVTLDHGPAPKEAAYVARMPKEKLQVIARFLSELKADAGSSVAKKPPPGKSPFIDNMVEMWAPKDWNDRFKDVRKQDDAGKAGE